MKTMDSNNLIHEKRHHGGKNNGNRGNRGNGGNGGAFQAKGNYTQEQYNGEFNFDTIHGLKLKEVEYKVPSMAERKAKRAEFNGDRENGVEGVRSKFLKMLANEHEKELVEKLGLTQTDIDGMKKGFTPNGFNVHHKLALHGGGKNEFKNFILTPLYPHDQWHHDVMDPQIAGIREGEARKILIPYTDEMIYDPKKYGFTKDNEKVQPDYKSQVNPEGYAKYWLPEHISVEKRQEDMKELYAQYAARDAERKAQKQEAPKKNRVATAAMLAQKMRTR